jgi:hypothetical protein
MKQKLNTILLVFTSSMFYAAWHSSRIVHDLRPQFLTNFKFQMHVN